MCVPHLHMLSGVYSKDNDGTHLPTTSDVPLAHFRHYVNEVWWWNSSFTSVFLHLQRVESFAFNFKQATVSHDTQIEGTVVCLNYG